MELGVCKFNNGQKGKVTLSGDHKSVTIVPSAWILPDKWPASAPHPKGVDDPVTLPLVAATNDGADLMRLAKAGTLKMGTWRDTGHWTPDKLFCYSNQCDVIVAEFAAPGVPAGAGK